ncbi:putative peptidase S10, serine carboxypeptidase, alpha/Beta hydrolase [Helianthus anomalus]
MQPPMKMQQFLQENQFGNWLFHLQYFINFIICSEAHMFWWYYKSPYRTQDPNNPWPVILWLQGGPVSLKLINGGAVNVGKYGQNCTHVIVDKLV